MLLGVWMRRAIATLAVLVAACAGRSGRSTDGSSGGAAGSASGGTGGDGVAGSSGGSAGSEGGSAGGAGESAGHDGGEAGSSGSSGSTSGSSGEAGFAGSGGIAGGSGGSGGSGGQVDPTPRPCNRSDGSGCEPGEVCLAVAAEACESSSITDCGLCGPALPRSTCEVDLAQCTGTVTCPAIPGACPSGLVRSIVDECFGPCVPVDCCGCTSDFDCVLDDGSCDRATGRCVVPAAPEPRCFLPFDPEACETTARVFVFIDGHCQEQTGAYCGVNANSFFTLEECLRRCEGLPQQSECPEGRVSRTVCLECGPGGGCARTNTVCAKACSTMDDCDPGEGCLDGACGATFCV
jgi:hypothetical protein